MGQGAVGILTFHRCINYGSYWQARAMVEGLRGLGRAAVLLDHRSPRIDRAEWRCALQPLLPRPTPRHERPRYAAKARKFFEAAERLPRSRPFALETPQSMERHEVVLVGSDEVWNFQHPWYAACPAFFGEGLKTDRLVAYAASFGNHDAGHTVPEPWADRLRRFDALGVRDDNSAQLVRSAVGREPAMVLDPCLQFDHVCRREPSGDRPGQAVVYGHSFPPAFGRAVRRWAQARGLKLVSVGYRNDWADAQDLEAGPEDFAQAISDAAAVITNFFHGCVFALLNAKPFVCAISPYRANKVSALVRAAGAERRLASGPVPDEELSELLDTPLEPAVTARLATQRSHSASYLAQALA